jgi:hypothetical protein
MVIVLLAALDLWGIRRYARRHLRHLQQEHRAQLEEDLASFRSKRNGHVEQ